jgi:hypothetical protein
MILGTLNMDEVLADYFPGTYEMIPLTGEELPEVDALFIDWIPRGKKKTPAIIQQAKVINHYVKHKKRTVIFDRYLGMTSNEHEWLKKFNVVFTEPAIKFRSGFTTLMPWTETYHLGSYPEIDHDKKTIDLATKDLLRNKIGPFEDYYVEFATHYPKFSVTYWSNLLKEKEDEFKEAGLKKRSFEFEEVKATILIGTKTAYDVGYLYPETFNLMRKGVLPLLPKEHKYFWSLFDELLIDKIGWIGYNLSVYEVTAIPLLVDVYQNVEKMWPEMKIEHTVDFLTRKLER